MLLILGNQITTVVAVFFLVMAFVRITPFIISFMSLITYGVTVAYLQEPGLWRFYCFFVFDDFFLSIMGEVLWRNVKSVSDENKNLHHWESALMHAVRLNRREIEGYLRMSSAPNHIVPQYQIKRRAFSLQFLSFARLFASQEVRPLHDTNRHESLPVSPNMIKFVV